MPRAEIVRDQVRTLLRAVPFKPFVLNMENGDRLLIEHPENIGYNPTAPVNSLRAARLSVTSGDLQFLGTFDAVTTVALKDTGEPSE